jgi:hypothetical protein
VQAGFTNLTASAAQPAEQEPRDRSPSERRPRPENLEL